MSRVRNRDVPRLRRGVRGLRLMTIAAPLQSRPTIVPVTAPQGLSDGCLRADWPRLFLAAEFNNHCRDGCSLAMGMGIIGNTMWLACLAL